MSDADTAYERLVMRGETWAEKEHAASILEETRKSVRAQIAVKSLKEAGSAAKAELMAEASKQYEEHIRAMVSARKEANLAKVNYGAAQVWCEMFRTLEATKRAAMKMI